MQIPNTFFRISIKALIQDQAGRLLMVKEDCDDWEIPGGGMDHGETIEQALRREIREELGVEVSNISTQPVFIWTVYSSEKDWHGLWLVYAAEIQSHNFVKVPEVSAIQFMAAAEVEHIPLDETLAGYRSQIVAHLRQEHSTQNHGIINP